jgi:hypothetical protein
MYGYVQIVTAHPILSAVIQFAILGTLGEFLAQWVAHKRFFMPFTLLLTGWKMVVWAILGVCIKYAFTGMEGFVNALVEHNLLPAACGPAGLAHAFAKSMAANLQFGLFLVLFHRVLDNLVVTRKNWANLHKAMYSLLWFWIPAHTVTFSLPKEFQIGLAALWSLVLGIILGSFSQKKSA